MRYFKKGVDEMRVKLVDFRKNLGYTIEEMSERVGVSASFYEKIEYGDRNPSFNFITLFKKTFPTADANYIFFDNEHHKTCS